MKSCAGWAWQSVDGCMVQAAVVREAVGRNPTDWGGKGTKRSHAVESPGLPVGVVVSGANTHALKLLEETLQSILTAYPEGAHLCLDAGYVGSQKLVAAMGYKVHIRRRGGQEKEKNVQFVAWR